MSTFSSSVGGCGCEPRCADYGTEGITFTSAVWIVSAFSTRSNYYFVGFEVLNASLKYIHTVLFIVFE